MKSFTLRSSALMALMLTVLSGCTSCHCPTCPATMQSPPATTTIIHDAPQQDQ